MGYATLAAALIVVDRTVIAREERYLERRFGDAMRELEHRSAQRLAAGLPAEPRPPPAVRCLVALGVPLGLEDIRGHDVQGSTAIIAMLGPRPAVV